MSHLGQNRKLGTSTCFPLFSQQRTLRTAVGMSEKCRIRTHALAARLRPDLLELEITESVLMNNNEATLAALHQLRDLGVRISMDDFGTGYSSLSYLRSFPFDKIKIDQSFIRDLAERPESNAIIRAVAGLGQSFGDDITATKLAVDCQIEHGEIASAALDLELCPDRPDVFGSQRWLCPHPDGGCRGRWIQGGSRNDPAKENWTACQMSFYLANYANYDATYGSLGAAIGLMVWMWMSTIVILLGAELSAEIERQTTKDTTDGGNKPLGARKATVADTVGAAKT
jgi:hypothetical protein